MKVVEIGIVLGSGLVQGYGNFGKHITLDEYRKVVTEAQNLINEVLLADTTSPDKDSCRDFATYGECLSRYMYNQCKSEDSFSKCRRTCGLCSIGFENDYCYDKFTLLTSTEIADSANAISPHLKYEKFRPETIFCNKIRENDQENLIKYITETGLLKSLFKDLLPTALLTADSLLESNGQKSLLCDGLGGRICQYTCGQCKTHSAVDGSDLNCYQKHNLWARYYIGMKSTDVPTVSLKQQCPLSGKQAEDPLEETIRKEVITIEEQFDEQLRLKKQHIPQGAPGYLPSMSKAIHQDELIFDPNRFNVNRARNFKPSQPEPICSSHKDDFGKLEKILKQHYDNTNVKCEVTDCNGPREKVYRCTVTCNHGKFVTMSRHDGFGQNFHFECFGNKSRACRPYYCRNHPKDPTCSKCTSLFSCTGLEGNHRYKQIAGILEDAKCSKEFVVTV